MQTRFLKATKIKIKYATDGSVRSPVFYPTKLQAHVCIILEFDKKVNYFFQVF